MNQLEQHIQKKYEEIVVIKTEVKDSLLELLDCYFEMNLLLQTYKSQTKSHFTRQLSVLFDIPIGFVHNTIKKIKTVAKKNRIDRISLEAMEIIDKPDRKNSQRKINEKPAVLEIGELIGKIRNINEKGMSNTSKGMVKTLLEQLSRDL